MRDTAKPKVAASDEQVEDSASLSAGLASNLRRMWREVPVIRSPTRMTPPHGCRGAPDSG